MSRLAKKTIPVPSGVKVEIGGTTLRVKGPKGELTLSLLPGVAVDVVKEGETEAVAVKREGSETGGPANQGTMWSLVTNALEGVVGGFSKVLEVQGIGFKTAVEGKTLVLSLGFVKPVRFAIPEGVSISVEKNFITVSGHDKQLVGQTASRIRLLKKPEPYKGKGIRYRGEVVRIKAGKKAATTATK